MKKVFYLFIGLLLTACEPREIENPTEYQLKDISIDSVDVHWRSIKMFDKTNGFIGGIPLTRFNVHHSNELDMLFSDTIIYNIDHTYKENGLDPEPCLFRTTDGGISWLPLETPFRNGVMDIHFVDVLIGFVITFDEGVYKTSDGGITWEKILATWIFAGGSVFKANWNISFKDEYQGFAYINWEHSLKSIDGGDSWEKNLMALGSYIYHKDETSFAKSSTKLFKTEDNGNTWLEVDSDSEFIFHVWFNSSEWFYIANGSNILETRDGGVNWESYQLGSFYPAEQLFMFGNEVFLLDNTGVYHFPNFTDLSLPKRYYRLTSKRTERIFDIAFPDSLTGFAVGDNGLILKYERTDPE